MNIFWWVFSIYWWVMAVFIALLWVRGERRERIEREAYQMWIDQIIAETNQQFLKGDDNDD